MVLNAIRSIVSVLFPMITFRYVSRILGVENIGRFNYARSIASYFILIAGLGIENYAVREGAAYRENPKRLNLFVDEVFTINLLATVASYVLLAIVIYVFPGIQRYSSLLMILSAQILLKTLGVEYVYSIYEDYLYITIRSIAFQLISLILLYSFVHTQNDVNLYAFITVIANVGSSLMNFIHSRKRLRITPTVTIDWKRHMRPILVMFAMTLTATIYVNSDITILGILCGDETVGIYAASTRVYTVVKGILSTVIVVSIPRLSAFYGMGRLHEFRETAKEVYINLLSVVMPAITGVIILRRPIILLISGPEYVGASSSLAILGVALFMSMAAWFWSQCILVPARRENELFIITLISAILNLILNYLLIPIWQENAAAFTTVLAEGFVFIWSMIKGKRDCDMRGIRGIYLKTTVGCVGIIAVNEITKNTIDDYTLYAITTFVASIVVYAAIELFLKNEAIYSLARGIKGFIKTKREKA